MRNKVGDLSRFHPLYEIKPCYFNVILMSFSIKWRGYDLLVTHRYLVFKCITEAMTYTCKLTT